jgi:hypothetical protein
MARIGFAPGVESRAVGFRGQVVVQQRQPVSRLEDHLF